MIMSWLSTLFYLWFTRLVDGMAPGTMVVHSSRAAAASLPLHDEKPPRLALQQQHRQQRWLEATVAPTPTPYPDFTGDLEQIRKDALEKAQSEGYLDSDAPSLSPSTRPSDAPSNVPSGSPVPTLTAGPTASPSMTPLNTCPNAVLEHLSILTWRYQIEVVAAADPVQVIGEVDEILQERIAPLLLECSPRRSANASLAHIVGLDTSLPRDLISSTTVCAPADPTRDDCYVVDGSVRLFLSDAAAAPTALYLTLQALKDAVADPTFVYQVATGLVNITFIDLDNNDSPSQGDNNSADGNISSGGLGLTSVVMVTVAGAAVLVLISALLVWRKNKSSSSDSAKEVANVTTFAASSMCESGGDGNTVGRLGSLLSPDNSSSSQNPNSTSSPVYTEADSSCEGMLIPTHYRFTTNDLSLLPPANNNNRSSSMMLMSPVVEDCSSSIVVSECGYSTDGGSGSQDYSFNDMPKTLLYTKQPEAANSSLRSESPDLLGAKKRRPGQMHPTAASAMDFLTDDEDDLTRDDSSSGDHTPPTPPTPAKSSLRAAMTSLLPLCGLDQTGGHVEEISEDVVAARDDEALLFETKPRREEEKQEIDDDLPPV